MAIPGVAEEGRGKRWAVPHLGTGVGIWVISQNVRMSAKSRTARLSFESASDHAARFAVLADPERLRLLHALAVEPDGLTSGVIADVLGLAPASVEEHVEVLASAGLVTRGPEGFVQVAREGRWSFPNPVDTTLGLLEVPLGSPAAPVPAGVRLRGMEPEDLERVRQIYAEGIATSDATFETRVPDAGALEAKWLRGHRWVAEVYGEVTGWAAAAPTSGRPVYAGVVETSVYVAEKARGRGVARALLQHQVAEADRCGLWTLRTSIFPENRASLALHRSVGFRTLGVLACVGEHHGTWRDIVSMERSRQR